MEKDRDQYVIGVDGGGTKTTAALADLQGRILRRVKSGPASPTNVGIKVAAASVEKAIKGVWPKKGKVLFISLGLPAVAERPELARKVKKEIKIFRKGKMKIVSDQLVAFQAGTDQKDGLIIIAGTGCAAHGWQGKRETHSSGWGWLADEGSAFFVGQKVFQAVLKDLDGRGPKTLLTKLVFQKFKLRKIKDLINLVYLKNPTEIIPQFSILCYEAGRKRDNLAKNILVEAGKELALAAKTVIKKLKFSKAKFPLVLVGSMFKSRILLGAFKKDIKKSAPKVEFVQPKAEPVIGAVKLAIEQLKIK